MDIVEFAEKIMGAELKDWQRVHIKTLYDHHKDGYVRIVMPKNVGSHQVYIYMNQKGLIANGSQNHSK